MNKIIRHQLTLFVDKNEAGGIENIRKKFNPEQYRLIDSHVTLCRENEIENISIVLDNLQHIDSTKIAIQFGEPLRFNNGKGVLLPALVNEQFQTLRSKILAGLELTVTLHEPHITLMHPRNSECTDEIFKTIQESQLPKFLTFDKISLIEQVNCGQWQILGTYELNDS